ncbi:MAG: RNA polymerase sigma factor [Bdellovibrionota bacterium]
MRKIGFISICLLIGCAQLSALETYPPKPCAEHAEAEGQSLEWMMSQILAGREEIWDSLIPRLVDPLTRYFRRSGDGVRDHADDLTQITLIKLYEKASLYDPSKKLLPWLYRIAHNEMVAWMRHRNRLRQVRPAYVDEIGLMQFSNDGRNTIDENELFQNRRDELMAAIPQLRNDRRKQVVRLVLKGFNDEQIAYILNIPVATVRWNRNTATKELREMLQP